MAQASRRFTRVARNIRQQATDVGVDIILFDGEDWGENTALNNRPPGKS